MATTKLQKRGQKGRLYLFCRYDLGDFNHIVGDNYDCRIVVCLPDRIHLVAEQFAEENNSDEDAGAAYVYDLTDMDFVGVFKMPEPDGVWHPAERKKK